ncbi:MAG TPA: hypothetical protein VM261_01995 [Kofleriaceae bacterium]|nr:hypothetical protein [Kofleriaceae bacterium]
MYRYGDGTPFPFEENFIDIVGAAVDACAGMFTAAAQLEALRAKAREAKREADAEGAKLAALERSIEGAVALSSPSVAKDSTLVQQTALRALEGARHAITTARGALEKRTAAASAEPRIDRAMQTAFGAAASFFDTHHLPRTAWSWSWKANVGATASAFAAKFTVSFDLPDVPWNGPAKLSGLVPGMVVRLPHKRLIGKPSLQKIHVDKGALMEVERDGDEITMVIRESANKKSAGWGIHLDSLAATAATVTLLDDDGSLSGVEMVLGGEEGLALARLASAIVDEMEPSLSRRRTREVTIGKTSFRSMTDPAEPAKALLDLLAPTIKTMCQKSRVPGEISLKRDIADGKREELFVSRAMLASKYASLPPEYRSMFDGAGLGRDSHSVDDDEQTQTDRRPPQHADHGGGVSHRPVPPPPPPPIRAAPNAKTLMAS